MSRGNLQEGNGVCLFRRADHPSKRRSEKTDGGGSSKIGSLGKTLRKFPVKRLLGRNFQTTKILPEGLQGTGGGKWKISGQRDKMTRDFNGA